MSCPVTSDNKITKPVFLDIRAMRTHNANFKESKKKQSQKQPTV